MKDPLSPKPTDAWRKALLPGNATLQEAIRNLDDSAMQIALVVSETDVLLGTITDGDIRRGLLRGLSLTSSIDSVVHADPMVVPPEFSRDMVLQLMRSNKVLQLPVVNEDRQVVGLHVLDRLMEPKKRPNLMVIMAGGKGTRLRPHTEECPKPLLPVAGKPMLEHIIQRAKSEGFEHFVLSVNYLGHMIEEHFGDGSRWQVQISYLREDSRWAPPVPSACWTSGPSGRFWYPTAMCLATSTMATCSTFMADKARRQPWRCACTNGSTRSASSIPMASKLPGSRKSR